MSEKVCEVILVLFGSESWLLNPLNFKQTIKWMGARLISRDMTKNK